jgi:hypothetical protein
MFKFQTNGNISLLVLISKEISEDKTEIMRGTLKEETRKWRRDFSAEGNCRCRKKTNKKCNGQNRK